MGTTKASRAETSGDCEVNRKPFKGVIRDWSCIEGVARGICVWHADSVPMSAHAALYDAIVAGERMRTSKVVEILYFDTFAMLHTKNSYYVLIEPRGEANGKRGDPPVPDPLGR